MKVVEAAWQPLVELSASRSGRSEDMAKLAERADMIRQDMTAVEKPYDGFVAWSEGDGEHKRHIVAPVETGPVLNEHLWERPASFALLSATLRSSGTFEYAKSRLGLAMRVSMVSLSNRFTPPRLTTNSRH